MLPDSLSLRRIASRAGHKQPRNHRTLRCKVLTVGLFVPKPRGGTDRRLEFSPDVLACSACVRRSPPGSAPVVTQLLSSVVGLANREHAPETIPRMWESPGWSWPSISEGKRSHPRSRLHHANPARPSVA